MKKVYRLPFHGSHFWGKVPPEMNLWRAPPWGDSWKLLPCCECMNITRPHTLATCYLSFTVPPQTAAERLSILFLSYSSVAFFPLVFFCARSRNNKKKQQFLYFILCFCIWLLAKREGTVGDFTGISMRSCQVHITAFSLFCNRVQQALFPIVILYDNK